MSKRNCTQEDHQQRVAEVLKFVRSHSETALSLPELADVACQSPFHFERVFQEQTSVKVMEHVRTFRLVRAAIDLRLTDRKIVDIALDAGYANHESFSRAFRRHFGLSPRKYRNRADVSSTKAQGVSMGDVKVGLVKIPVTDFKAATHYYRKIVGLVEEFAVEVYGWAQYQTNNIPLCLYVVGQGGGDGVPGGDTGFHLEVDNIKTFYADIQKRGGQFASDIVQSDDGGMFFVLRDPDGNTFKVIQCSAASS